MFFKKFFDNAKDYTTKASVWKDVGMAAGGAASYSIVPTAVQAITKIDMRGWKGAITGVSINSIISFAIGSPGWFLGTLTAFSFHFLYARLNQWVVYPVFNEYLFRWDPSVYDNNLSDCVGCVPNSSMADDLPPSQQLQPGAKVIEVGGRKVQVFDKADVEVAIPRQLDANATTTTTAMSGFRNSTTMSGFRNSGMSGFRTSGMSGFRNSGSHQPIRFRNAA